MKYALTQNIKADDPKPEKKACDPAPGKIKRRGGGGVTSWRGGLLPSRAISLRGSGRWGEDGRVFAADSISFDLFPSFNHTAILLSIRIYIFSLS